MVSSRGIAALVAAGVMVAAGSAAAQGTGRTGAPDPGLTGVAPAETPSNTAPPGPLTPAPTTDPALNPTQASPPPADVPPAAMENSATVPPEGTMSPLQRADEGGRATGAGMGTPERPEAYGMESGRFLPRTGIGIALMAGGGVSDYTGSGVRNSTGTAGSWDLRAVAGTRSFVAVEAAYVGAAQSIRGIGLQSDARLVRNGVEGVLRLQAPIALRVALLEPYVFGGVGWNHYTLTNTPLATADVKSSDDVLTVPAGAGFSAGYRGFMADVRFTYRPTFRQTLFTGTARDGLTNWQAGAALGYEF
jgi:hypothetical protein